MMGNMKFNPGRRRRPVGSKRSKHRKLGLQSLENRNLLAGDLGVEIFASDINGDGEVTPVDALQVINALHSQNKGGVIEDLASVDVNKDGVLTPRDALVVINQLNSDRTLLRQSETSLRDRVVERLGDRDPSETLGDEAIRDIAQRLGERRSERDSIEGLKELVIAAREDGEVTEAERAEIRELVGAELAERGRDGGNIDPERQERRQERREERREERQERRQERREERREERQEERREQRDSDVDSQRREQLRERIAARRAASGRFLRR